MSYPANMPMAFQEQSAFETALSPILASVHGTAPLRIPDEYIGDTGAMHHAIINAYRDQSDWFESYFAGQDDTRACNYVLVQLQRKLRDRAIPFEVEPTDHSADNPGSFVEHIRSFAGKGKGFTKMLQIEVKSVTCFQDGDRRRFIAHFDSSFVKL
jgi:hypothetical protein